MTEEKWDDENKVGGKYMAGVIADFAPALKEIAKLGSMSNKPNGKYARGSWKLVKDPLVKYGDAFWRHLLEGPIEIDPETGKPHDVAIAWNALALICFRLEQEATHKQKEDEVQPIGNCSICGGELNDKAQCTEPKCPMLSEKSLYTTELGTNRWIWMMDYCKEKGLAPASVASWGLANAAYEAKDD